VPRRAKIRPDDPGYRRIRQSAAELFAQKGFEGTSIADIGVRADITKSLLYHHFRSKAQLYEEVLCQATDELIQRVADAAASVPVSSRFSAGIDAYLAFIADHPAVGRLLLREPPANGELAALHHRLNVKRHEALEALLATQRKRENQRAHIGLAATAIRTFALWWLEHPDVGRDEVRTAILSTLRSAPSTT
jgi:AcrR family transcriptional regulator